MSGQEKKSAERPQCAYFHFGLIVTGKSERLHLPKLFRSLMATGICTFEVIRRVNQRGGSTSGEELTGIRNGKNIPNRDEKIGLWARTYLATDACRFVVLIDDLEHDRKDQAQQVFDRYRLALDTVLNTLKHRASVHFLVNMLEAYYFADAKSINAVLGTSLSDYEGDVEDIRHPKGELKELYSGFDEIEHGGEILEQIDIAHVLSRPDTCASLRTLFAWCVKVFAQYSDDDCASFDDKYKLQDGKLSEITRAQLDNI